MPVVNRITKELIACGVISASRYYLYFDGNSSITLPPVSMTGARTITMMFRVPNALNDYIRLYGYGSSTTYSRIYISQTGVLSFSPDNTIPPISTSGGKVLPDVTYKLEINILAAGWYLKLNGTTLLSSTANLTETTTTVDRIGESYSTKSKPVYIWDVNFNNQRLYKLDENAYPSLIFKDSIDGQDGNGYNFQESSFVRSINA
jgi:hypothetical protein